MPIVITVGGALVLRDVEMGLRIALSLFATFLASILGIALILFLGIPFHFWIGGTL